MAPTASAVGSALEDAARARVMGVMGAPAAVERTAGVAWDAANWLHAPNVVSGGQHAVYIHIVRTRLSLFLSPSELQMWLKVPVFRLH